MHRSANYRAGRHTTATYMYGASMHRSANYRAGRHTTATYVASMHRSANYRAGRHTTATYVASMHRSANYRAGRHTTATYGASMHRSANYRAGRHTTATYGASMHRSANYRAGRHTTTTCSQHATGQQTIELAVTPPLHMEPACTGQQNILASTTTLTTGKVRGCDLIFNFVSSLLLLQCILAYGLRVCMFLPINRSIINKKKINPLSTRPHQNVVWCNNS